MPNEQPKEATVFDQYAEDYDVALSQGLSLTGEGKAYFARKRILWLCQLLRSIPISPKRILDYGCGTGSTIPLFIELLKPDSVVGVDTSIRSLHLAREQRPKCCDFFLNSEYNPRNEFDLAYCNGVFHHISPADRGTALNYIHAGLRPGGLFAFWENNPWNPGTRYVMSRTPFDDDAIMLKPREAIRLLRKNGFRVLQCDFLFFFPRFLKSLRWMEPLLSGLPLGGQYQVLCQRPG